MSTTITLVESELRDRRVIPAIPAGRSPHAIDTDGEASPGLRDEVSGAGTYIRYINATGEETERRITCHRMEGFGRPETILAYCHESLRPKTFRIDRIQELVDLSTGEIVDPVRHFDRLHLHGLLGLEDKALTEVAKMLVFLARCDGLFHPLEESAVDETFGRYVLRFGGTDACVEKACLGSRALAPDSNDFVRSLRRIEAGNNSAALARLILASTSVIIDADGVHDDQEVVWALRVSDALKQIATR